MTRVAVAVCVALLSVASNAMGLCLTKEGRSSYVIVLPDQATASVEATARELQEHLEQVTGAKLPIRREGELDEDAPQIVVGVSDRMRQLVPDVTPKTSPSSRTRRVLSVTT